MANALRVGDHLLERAGVRAVAEAASGRVSAEGSAHVVIVGGGFAGVGCARRLAGEDGVRVTLIDRNNYHQFQPLTSIYDFLGVPVTMGSSLLVAVMQTLWHRSVEPGRA